MNEKQEPAAQTVKALRVWKVQEMEGILGMHVATREVGLGDQGSAILKNQMIRQ